MFSWHKAQFIQYCPHKHVKTDIGALQPNANTSAVTFHWTPIASLADPKGLNITDQNKTGNSKYCSYCGIFTGSISFDYEGDFFLLFFWFFLGGTFWSYYLDSCQPYSKAAHSTCPRQEAWPEDHPPSPTPWETSSRATWWAFGWVCGKGCGWGVDGLLLLAQRDNMIQTDVTTPITMQSGLHSHTRLLKQSVQNFTAQ